MCNNFDLVFAPYKVVKTANVISIDFQDPEGHPNIDQGYNYGLGSFMIMYSNDGETCLAGGAQFLGIKFAKAPGNTDL